MSNVILLTSYAPITQYAYKFGDFKKIVLLSISRLKYLNIVKQCYALYVTFLDSTQSSKVK